MLNRFIMLCVLVCLYVSVVVYVKVVLVIDVGYVYIGCIDFVNVSVFYLIWFGLLVKVCFFGEFLLIMLKDDNGKNYYNVIVDGNDVFFFVIEVK